jgi:hypothetical protein
MPKAYQPAVTGYRSAVQELASDLDDVLHAGRELPDRLRDRLLRPVLRKLCRAPANSYADLADKLDVVAHGSGVEYVQAGLLASVHADLVRLADAEDGAAETNPRPVS